MSGQRNNHLCIPLLAQRFKSGLLKFYAVGGI